MTDRPITPELLAELSERFQRLFIHPTPSPQDRTASGWHKQREQREGKRTGKAPRSAGVVGKGPSVPQEARSAEDGSDFDRAGGRG